MNETKPVAAVLLAIVLEPNAPYILLTERASDLRKHAGQISLPGGRMDSGDVSIEATAIREFQEETGIIQSVTVLGQLSPQHSSSGYIVYPICGTIAPIHQLRIQTSEVKSIIHLPLSFATELSNFQTIDVTGLYNIRHRYTLEYEQHLIWGLTATILHEFALSNFWQVYLGKKI